MNRQHILLILYFLLTTVSPAYSYQENQIHDWPKLEGNQNKMECIDTFTLAKANFKSNQFDISNIFSLPLDKIKNISFNDKSIFEKIERKEQDQSNDGNFSLYWQRQPNHRSRWIIKEESYGWRGNTYTLYIINADISLDKFLTNPGTSVINETWNAPLLMREKATGKLWAIDVGEPYVVFSDWTVFTTEGGKSIQPCKIRFRPAVKTPIELLPLPVRQLEKLLDETLGNGEGDGSSHSTAQLRTYVSHTWANVALRPWALVCAKQAELCSNSRKKTDIELNKWSHKAASFKKLRDRIYQQYPNAEKALAKYYEYTFNLVPKKAKIMAQYALNNAFLSHFGWVR